MGKLFKIVASQLRDRWAQLILLMLELCAVIVVFTFVWADIDTYFKTVGLYDRLSLDRSVLIHNPGEEKENPLADEVAESIEGVTLLGTGDSSYTILAKGHDFPDYMVDNNLNLFPPSFVPFMAQIPLSQGQWFSLDTDYGENVVAIVVPYSLRDTYRVGQNYDVQVFYSTLDGSKKQWVTLHVCGVLKNDIQYMGGNIVIQNGQDICAFDPSGQLMAQSGAIGGRSVFMVSPDRSYEETLARIREIAPDAEDSFDAKESMRSISLQNISLPLFILIMIVVVSIAGFASYNLLSAYENEKSNAVYYLCGATWRQTVGIQLCKNAFLLFVPLILAFVFLFVTMKPLRLSGFGLIALFILLVFGITSFIGMLSQRKASPIDGIRKWL